MYKEVRHFEPRIQFLYYFLRLQVESLLFHVCAYRMPCSLTAVDTRRNFEWRKWSAFGVHLPFSSTPFTSPRMIDHTPWKPFNVPMHCNKFEAIKGETFVAVTKPTWVFVWLSSVGHGRCILFQLKLHCQNFCSFPLSSPFALGGWCCCRCFTKYHFVCRVHCATCKCACLCKLERLQWNLN